MSSSWWTLTGLAGGRVEAEQEGDRTATRRASAVDASESKQKVYTSWNSAYAKRRVRAVSLNELRLAGAVTVLLQLVVSITYPSVLYAQFYSRDSRLTALPILTWATTVATACLAIGGLVLLQSLLLGLHAVMSGALAAALGALHTGVYLLMVDRCERAQSSFRGCASCACAAAGNCTRDWLGSATCAPCTAWPTDVCSEVDGSLAALGPVLLFAVALPAVYSVMILMRLERSNGDLDARVVYARALVARELQRVRGHRGLGPGVAPHLLRHTMTTLLRHGAVRDGVAVRSCCAALGWDVGALEAECWGGEAGAAPAALPAPPSLAPSTAAAFGDDGAFPRAPQAATYPASTTHPMSAAPSAPAGDNKDRAEAAAGAAAETMAAAAAQPALPPGTVASGWVAADDDPSFPKTAARNVPVSVDGGEPSKFGTVSSGGSSSGSGGARGSSSRGSGGSVLGGSPTRDSAGSLGPVSPLLLQQPKAAAIDTSLPVTNSTTTTTTTTTTAAHITGTTGSSNGSGPHASDLVMDFDSNEAAEGTTAATKSAPARKAEAEMTSERPVPATLLPRGRNGSAATTSSATAAPADTAFSATRVPSPSANAALSPTAATNTATHMPTTAAAAAAAAAAARAAVPTVPTAPAGPTTTTTTVTATSLSTARPSATSSASAVGGVTSTSRPSWAAASSPPASTETSSPPTAATAAVQPPPQQPAARTASVTPVPVPDAGPTARKPQAAASGRRLSTTSGKGPMALLSERLSSTSQPAVRTSVPAGTPPSAAGGSSAGTAATGVSPSSSSSPASTRRRSQVAPETAAASALASPTLTAPPPAAVRQEAALSRSAAGVTYGGAGGGGGGEGAGAGGGRGGAGGEGGAAAARQLGTVQLQSESTPDSSRFRKPRQLRKPRGERVEL